MNKKDIGKSDKSLFEKLKHLDGNGIEYWSARELAKILEYSEYRHFEPAIERAKDACKNSGQPVEYHFEDVLEMILIGKGGKRGVISIKLSRYACYLIVQNADSSKEVVALGQTYFAVQTRLQELQQLDEYNNLDTEEKKRLFLRNEMKKHNTQLAAAAKDAGVVQPWEYAVFQNHGYQGLYGGLGAKEIHRKKELKKSQQILDHMGSTELAANLFRATQTEEKLKRDKIKGKVKANKTHFEVGRKVRQTIEDIGGTMPENLPVEDSVKKIERKEQKKLKDSEG
jgi:DNA-damage-inducible protein D